MDLSENKRKMRRGELYHAFTPELLAERTRCKHACMRFNACGEVPLRRQLELWKDIVQDTKPLPPPAATPEEDEAQLDHEPRVEPPVCVDYGYNVHIGENVFINFNCTILDTCQVHIGARTLIGPNVSLFAATHPLDPVLRNGTRGPELGKDIVIGEDCWIGGNAIILCGVTLGRGVVIGAGSVVTKSVPAFHVAAGNPARILRKIETSLDPDFGGTTPGIEKESGAEKPMAEAT